MKSIPEFTVKAVTLGIILALVMCAANTYLGLYAGMTVSASIPAAVISMGILRGILRRGSILENNIVQTSASAGESVAAGIIFTIPALVITGIWQSFGYWVTSLVALLGGLLGVVLMIPLRKTLIVEKKELTYPEGVACAEVLKVGETRGTGIVYVFSALGLGALFKFFVSGVSCIKHVVEGATRVGKTAIYGGSDMSVALIGIGYIVGFNIALLVFLGGAIGWLVGIPIYGAVRGFPEGVSLVDAFYEIWSTQIRYMGVGAMIVGGLWSIINVRHSIVTGFRQAILGVGAVRESVVERTEQNLSAKQVAAIIVIVAIPLFVLYGYLTQSWTIAIVASVVMLVAAFFFVAVSSYIVGLVGSSNNPVSGMTIITLLFASLLLLLFKMSGASGILAALGVAGVVCCAACTAGDVSQDLKTGHILGATPRRQQIAQMIGVTVSAFIIAPILIALHRAYGIGTGAPGSLAAPQASLFASITTAMFTDKGLPWDMVKIGAVIGAAFIAVDESLKRKDVIGSIRQRARFRLHVMPAAVGIYLPLGLSVPIVIGGVINLVVRKSVAKRERRSSHGVMHESEGEEPVKEAIHRGTLFSSGLIAGESIMGIVIAFLIVGRVKLPIEVFESDIVSVLAILVVITALVATSVARRKKVVG
jgi:putative OPT family oligopeptide transporter